MNVVTEDADTRLAEIAAQLERTRWAAELFDSQWRLVWVSNDLKALLGEDDPENLGIGRHILESRLAPAWQGTVTDESREQWMLENLPKIMHDTPGGKDTLATMLDVSLPLLEGLDPVRPPGLWASQLDFVHGDLPPLRTSYLALRGQDPAGGCTGTCYIYGPSLPPTLLTLVSRGDEGMFQRMARLRVPGRRQAAVLFADLQASGPLSRRLSSAAYFNLIQTLITAIDDVVVSHRGIVGKHAGDGVTAFFLVDDLGSPSGAARAALEAAREIRRAAASTASRIGGPAGPIDESSCLVNVGVHWGANLFMGQVVTGGRLEVTALGDEVNECARIQQSAREGELLASKQVLEHLTGGDAAGLEVDLDGLAYRVVADLSGASEKAVRDAGTLPVASF